jgi:hypothetical protein
MEMQKHIDKEKIQEERVRFNNYQREYERKIREADNERLRSYFYEYSSNIDDGKAIQDIYNFIKWIIDNK